VPPAESPGSTDPLLAPTSTTPPLNERGVLFCVGAVQFVNILDFMVVMPMGPDLATGIGIAPSHLGIVGGSYTAAASVAGLTCSTFLDRFDRRSALLVAMLGLALGTAMGGLATGLGTLVLARVIAGAFGGPATSLSMSIVADVVPAERRGRALGAVMGAFSAASVLGVPLGLELSRRFGFRVPFFFIAGLGLLISLSARALLPSLRGHLAAAALHGRRSLFATVSTLLAKPAVRLAYTLTALGAIGMFSLTPNIAAYVQFNLGYPRERIGLLYLVGGALSFFVTRLAGPLVDRFGTTTIASVGAVIFIADVSVGFVLPKPPLPVLVVFVIFMLASALRNIAVSTLVSKVPDPDERAGFMSLQSAVTHMASAVGAFGASQLLSERAGSPMLIGMPRVAVFCMSSMALLLPVAFLLERRVRLQAATTAVDKQVALLVESAPQRPPGRVAQPSGAPCRSGAFCRRHAPAPAPHKRLKFTHISSTTVRSRTGTSPAGGAPMSTFKHGLALATLLAPLTLFGTSLSTTGCDPEDTVDAVDAKIDCASICNRYKDCFDSSYDTDTCRSKCEDNSKADSSYDAKAEACDNCLDDASCAESFSCADKCLNVVP
jgi:predicted MFS family arabinose efflux permease